MKKYYFLIVLALILGLALAGCTFLSNIGQVPAIGQKGMPYSTANLVALWHFDDDALDSSGNNNDGTVYGASWVDGKLGNALSFDGTNDYVGIADSSILDITQGTWEAWIKFDTLPSVAGHPMNPLAKANQHWIHGSLNDTDSGTTDAIVVKIRVGGTRYCAQTSSYFITADVWYHVAGTYDGETLKLYVNGTLVNSNTAPSGDIDTGDQIMAVGTWSTLADYFQGTIDEVRIWDGALTAAEILYSFENEILHVDDDWVQWPGAYYTINEALAVADDGDTIIVHEGTYTDDIWVSSLGTPAGYRITKSVTLLGARAGNDPAGSTNRGGESILVRTNGVPYSLYVSGITIDGFTFTSGGGSGGGRLVIGDDADNVTIKNCIIKDISGTDPHGVYIYPEAYNALVEYNTFYNTAWEAIASGGASDAVISHNYISASGQHAIQWMNHAGSNNEISYNHISGIIDKNAIQYWGGAGATISHNVIDGGDTMYDGIWLDNAADDSTVSYNQIFDTIYAGINIRETCTGVTVIYNDISGCGTGVEKHVGDVTGVLVNYNNIAGNSWGVRNYDAGTLNATYNWWGHPGGPRRPAGNSGQISGPKAADQVSENVLYHPWLNGANSVTNIALDQTATASATYPSYTATRAVDGDYDTAWNAGADQPQWIEIDLGKGSTVVGLRLLPDQTPGGDTTHVVLFSDDGGMIEDLTFSDWTETNQWLEAWFDAPLHGVKTLRVTTTESPSWVAWFEIEVYGWQ